MNAESHHEATLFQAALELPTAEERAVYLDQACSDDPELRRRVEARLARCAPGEAPEAPPVIESALSPGDVITSSPLASSPVAVRRRLGSAVVGLTEREQKGEPDRGLDGR